MGKRGPKPSDGYDKTKVLSTRISADVRRALEGACRASGRTISSEVEYRLRRSFEEDANITERFGGRSIYAILRMAGAALSMTGDVAVSTRTGKLGDAGEFLNDPYAFDQAVDAVATVLEAFRPPGDPKPPSMKAALKAHGKKIPRGKNARAFHWAIQRLGLYAAVDIERSVAEAKTTLPSPHARIDKQDELARRIASDLGPLQARLKEKLK